MASQAQHARPLSLCFVALLTLCFGWPRLCGAQDNVDDLIQAKEDVVREVASLATELYQTRQTSLPNCRGRYSTHACGNIFPESTTCSRVFNDVKEGCGDCPATGRKVDLNASFVITPAGIDPANLRPDEIDSICTFQELDPLYREMSEKTGSKLWTYISTTNGISRVWPGVPLPRCQQPEDAYIKHCITLEARHRPWYVAASSGPKDVVLLIDVSGSMSTTLDINPLKTRWHVTQDALLGILETFGIRDYVQIVTFSSVATVLGNVTSARGSTLIEGTPEGLQILKEAVKNTGPDRGPTGGTDFRVGLDKAFDVLITSVQEEAFTDTPPTSECEKVILFLTDGIDCSVHPKLRCPTDKYDEEVGPTNTEHVRDGVRSILDLIDRRQQQLQDAGGSGTPARIFTFSMTEDADDRLPKLIACNNGGSWASIHETDDPLTKMGDYTRFLAWGRKSLDVIWSNIYEDSLGLGLMATAAMPVYSADTVSFDGSPIPGVLVGVVGHDAVIQEFVDAGLDPGTVVARLNRRSEVCHNVELADCQFQILRGKDSECPEIFDEADCYYLQKTDRYYTVEDENLLQFKAAENKCKQLGGELANIDSPEEHEFLSGLASNGGTWIGLKKIDSTWKWLPSKQEVDPGDTTLKAINGNFDYNCATIDRRGLQNNVESADCDEKTGYICEFRPDDNGDPPRECKKKSIIKVDFDYTYNLKPIRECRDYETAEPALTAKLIAALNLTTGDVMHPIGEEPLTTSQVTCCCPPPSDDISIPSCGAQ